MHTFINSPCALGKLQLPHRLIQGPLAGYSAAPFRDLFSSFRAPAYAVSEMLSAYDVVHKHRPEGRYLARGGYEKNLCYQIAGTDSGLMASAAMKLEALGAQLIDINCGCPKTKIRKKGAGSALLKQPQQLLRIIDAVRRAIRCPLTVKVRLQENQDDIILAQQLEQSGVDALIVHGRRITDGYDSPCNLQQIAKIKRATSLPIIANGDIHDLGSLQVAYEQSGCDAFMISRAGTGQPWLYEVLLSDASRQITRDTVLALFLIHLEGLATLESEYQAVLQSRKLIRYYFKHLLHDTFLQEFYRVTSLEQMKKLLLRRHF